MLQWKLSILKLIPLSQFSILCFTMKQHSAFYLPPPLSPQCSFLCHKTYLLAICAHIFLFFFLQALRVVYGNTARNRSWWSRIIFVIFQWYLSRAEGCSNLSQPRRGIGTSTVLSLLHTYLFPFINFFQVVFWAPYIYTPKWKEKKVKILPNQQNPNQPTSFNAGCRLKGTVQGSWNRLQKENWLFFIIQVNLKKKN